MKPCAWFALLASGCLVGGEVPVTKALAVAQLWRQQHASSDLPPRPTLPALQVIRAPEGAPMYAFDFPEGGWVVVSGSDATPPIAAYSPTGSWRSENPQAETWMIDCSRDLRDVELSQSGIVSPAASLREGARAAAALPVEVLPMTTTRWNQTAPYNAACPLDGGVRSVTGCVATAVAQVLAYWQYPTIGKGTRTYDIYTQPPQTLTVNFAEAPYDWAHMADRLNAASPATDIEAVSRLIYHAGTSIRTSYSAPGVSGSGSGADPSYVGLALVRVFGFAPSYDYILRDGAWAERIRTELAARRPVLISGRQTTGLAHMFIADGYDSQGLVHINWGWGGNRDGYFSLDRFNPGSYDFSQGNQAIIGLRPPDPTVTLQTPTEGSTWERALPVQLTASPSVAEVRFYVDGTLMATRTAPPFDTELDLQQLEAGAHELKVEGASRRGGLVSATTRSFSTSGPAVPSAPRFIEGPTAQTVTLGEPVTFTVRVAGSPAPEVTWSRSDSTGGAAQGPSWTFTPSLADDGAWIMAAARNPQGTAYSPWVQLRVRPAEGSAPVFTTPLQAQTAKAGETVAFRVAANGSPAPTFTWYRSDRAQPVEGVTGPVYAFVPTAADHGVWIMAIAENPAGRASSPWLQLTLVP